MVVMESAIPEVHELLVKITEARANWNGWGSATEGPDLEDAIKLVRDWQIGKGFDADDTDLTQMDAMVTLAVTLHRESRALEPIEAEIKVLLEETSEMNR